MTQRVSSQTLAELWKLDPSSVRHMAARGQIKRGADNLFDFDEAMAFRKAQISKYEVRTLLQTYNNGKSRTEPKILEHRAAKPTMEDLLGLPAVALPSMEDLLGLEPASKPAETLVAVVDDAVSRANEFHAVKMAKARQDLARAETRAGIEAGRYIDRNEVQKAAHDTARLHKAIFDGLPAKIAQAFPDPEGRPQVRKMVENAIEQAQHAYFSALKEVSGRK